MDNSCLVETTTIGFGRCTWSALSFTEAEAIARKLSVAASDNPVYPNPFFVVGLDGVSRCKYFAGERLDLQMAA